MEVEEMSVLVRDYDRLKRNKTQVNFISNISERFELVKILSEKPIHLRTLAKELNVSKRTIDRHISYLRREGFNINRNKFGQYEITTVPTEFSDLITSLFFMIHTIDQKNERK